jgi:glycogen synthase
MTERPLRILLVTNKCPPDFDGGYELRAFQLAHALRARGHQLDVVTSCFRDTYHGERDDPDWVHRIFRYVPVSNAKGLWRKIDRIYRLIAGTNVASENVPALERFLADRTYDLAYCFSMMRISFACAAPIQRRGIPTLWHAGDARIAEHFIDWPRDMFGYRLGMNTFARRWYAAEKETRFDHLAVVSQFLRDRFIESGLATRRIFVISRGVDFPLGRDIGRVRTDPPVFFMASRIDPQKGIHHAITAAALLLRRRPELAWRLEIAGQTLRPGYRDELKQQIAREGLGDRVRFLGRLSHADVLARMRDATAFLFTSTYGEPFSSTIIESMASGTPLIGSDDGSILDEPELRSSLARAGLDVIDRRYTIERILDQTEAAFGEVIAATAAAK